MLAARLVALRRAAGLTQHELAQALGVAQTTLALWESSDTPPRSDVLPKMARALGVPVESLLDPDAELPATRRAVPKGRVWELFERVATLPRRRREQIIEMLETFVDRYEDEQISKS